MHSLHLLLPLKNTVGLFLVIVKLLISKHGRNINRGNEVMEIENIYLITDGNCLERE